MAEVSYRRIGELLRGLFEVLAQHPDGVPAGQAIAATEQRVPATPYEQTTLPKGERRYENVLRWMTVDCVKAGWMVKAHGRWSITDEGRTAHATITDPEAFYRRANQLYFEWRKNTPKAPAAAAVGAAAVVPDDSGEKSASITFDQAEEQAWSEIERHVTTIDPYDFQELVAALLRGMGYHIGWIAPKGKDGGIDVIAFDDPLGTRPPRIKVQVKRQQQKVTVDGLRSFMAVLAGDDAGIFVNTGGFTEEAKVEARTQHSRRVTLVDLERLVDLWTEHYARLDETARRRLPLQPIYFLAPEG